MLAEFVRRNKEYRDLPIVSIIKRSSAVRFYECYPSKACMPLRKYMFSHRHHSVIVDGINLSHAAFNAKNFINKHQKDISFSLIY